MKMTKAAKMPKFWSSGMGHESAEAMKAAQVVSDVISMAKPARR